MNEGTMFVVVNFPAPWPPSTDWALFSRQVEEGRVSLIADTQGAVTLSLKRAHEEPRTFRFQRIRVVGGGRAVLSVAWSGNEASLRLNGHEVGAFDGEEFVLQTEGTPIRQERLHGALDVGAAKSEAESLFLATLLDIDQKLEEASRYSLIRAAGLLRQLLLDSPSLVDAANRGHREKFEFEVIDFQEPPPVPHEAHWQNLDPSHFPGAKTVKLNQQRLLQAPVLEMRGATATVRDLIRACANAKGGVHLGKARTSGEDTIINWDRAVALAGEEPSLRAVAGLCRVVIRGLVPLVERITQSPRQ
jgi:hypothetical protein